MNIEYIDVELNKLIQIFELNRQYLRKIPKIVEICKSALDNGNKILICGNGGSAADSQHFAAELIGRYKKERKALPAIALTTDTSILTAVGNDYGYDTIFSRQVEGLGKKGDVLIGISTSGHSKNVINAVEQAKKIGIFTISITGKNGGNLRDITDFNLNIDSIETNHIQECHLFIEHMICEGIEE